MDIGRDLLCICFEGCSITFMAKICRTFISLTLLTSCPNVFVLSPNMQGRENVEMKYCRICSNNWCYCLRRDSKKGFLGQIKKKHCCFWDPFQQMSPCLLLLGGWGNHWCLHLTLDIWCSLSNICLMLGSWSSHMTSLKWCAYTLYAYFFLKV